MSGGRVELGLGAGWFDGEHEAYGIPFPALGERFDRLEEQLAVITGLWGTPVGERFSFDGAHYQLRDSPALPKPVQAPRPPVIVGGGGARRTPRLAARFADEFNMPFSSVAATGDQFARVRQALGEAGRDPSSLRLSAAQVLCCGRDRAEVERRAAAIDRRVEDLHDGAVAGTPAEVVAKLEELREVGADTVYLQVLDLADLDHVRLVADEVLPAASVL
jgi:alkanesulfonate monooxygenase SsuD/methylene tetrahydromethanopterin reductase-like flavin-dependent oxidoreductase (luciferase family)